MDGAVHIFDMTTSKLIHKLEAHAAPIRSLSYAPDSSLLLTASDDGSVKVYDAGHAQITGTICGHASWVLSVAWSPDNTHFATG